MSTIARDTFALAVGDARHKRGYLKGPRDRATDRWRRDLKDWMAREGRSLTWLAEHPRIRTDKAALSRLLSGKTHTSAAIAKITELTGIDPPMLETTRSALVAKILRLSDKQAGVVESLIDQFEPKPPANDEN